MKLDLRKSAHIQTTENFEEGKIATHNTEIDYQKRYDDWQNNFQRNADGSIRKTVKKPNRSTEERKVLRVLDKKNDPNGENYNTNYDAREFIDKGRPHGSKQINKDHTIAAAEIIRDPEAAAHMTREEQASFADNDVNLIDLDSAANQSKGDSSMSEWLDSKRTGKHGEGQSQAEYFGLDEKELRERDKKARTEYKKQKDVGKKRSVKTGRQSQKAEAKRLAGKATRAIIMNLLADLARKIIGKFILWIKQKKRTLKKLGVALKDAIVEFIKDFKEKVVTTVETVVVVIAETIFGPIIRAIRSAWLVVKQGAKSLIEAIRWLKNPRNKNKPIGEKLLQVAKIVTGGLTGIGAIVLSQAIEKGLMQFPAFAFEIPLFGSLASIVGLFLGPLIAGIIGALVINLIDKLIVKKQKQDLNSQKVEKLNEVLKTEKQIKVVNESKLEKKKNEIAGSIRKRHKEAIEIMSDSVNQISENRKEIDATTQEINANSKEIDANTKKIDENLKKTDDDLDELLN